MSDAKHIPGPWAGKGYKHDHSVYACDGQMRICDMRGWGYLTGVGGLHLTEDEAAAVQDANKALIIVAPDLMTACEAQEAADTHFLSCEDCDAELPCDVWFDMDSHARRLRRAALARVRGEEVTA